MIQTTLTFFILFFTMILPQAPVTNEHVTLNVAVQATVSATTAGTVSFRFTPLEGIHVNTVPNIEWKLEKNSPFDIVGKPQYRKTDKDYLDPAHPVLFTVKAKGTAAPGRSVIKGKLNYFYCSDKDGWCNRFSQPIEIGIEIVK